MSRRLPFEARLALQGWLMGKQPDTLSVPEIRSHQRLLREFLAEHLVDNHKLRAFATWESGFVVET
jgi:hypothetical protein